MLIYNTTYHIEESVVKNFLIWIQECYIPTVLKTKMLRNPKMFDVLSNREPDVYNYSLQWEVDDSKTLHEWYTKHGIELNKEMMNIFKDKVIGFPTLLEVVELPKYD